jgi:hypothetical protein
MPSVLRTMVCLTHSHDDYVIVDLVFFLPVTVMTDSKPKVKVDEDELAMLRDMLNQKIVETSKRELDSQLTIRKLQKELTKIKAEKEAYRLEVERLKQDKG